MSDLLNTIVGVAATIGGWEFTKWLIDFRKNPYRYTCHDHSEVFKIKTNDQLAYRQIVEHHKQTHQERS